VIHASIQCGAPNPAEVVTAFLSGADRALVALDAPLGWPAPLGSAVAGHRAGEPIGRTGHELFRRLTDSVVKDETGQQSLDVGADRIARTAVAALGLLRDIRQRMNQPIPLAWESSDGGICAIEVYPAATLRQIGLTPRAYKKAADVSRRMQLFDALSDHAQIGEIRIACENHADAFDAAVCVLAGADFLRGWCRGPLDDQLAAAKKEGWIWFRNKR
jgi:predicted RNase H-like nuclease